MDKLIRIVEEGFESDKMRTLAEVKESFELEKRRILARVEEELESEKVRNMAKVEEGFESTKRSIVTQIKRYLNAWFHSPAETNMKLEFRNGITQKILTGEEIRGEGGVPIEVALVDDLSGGVVDSGPASSAKVEIVLLKGKSVEDEEFNANIVPEVEGKQQPILAGNNVPLQLQNGVAVVKNIKFRHHAISIKPATFMLGARIVGDGRIKEAKTKPFILKSFRAKYYKKHKNPSLADEVSRLVFIRKGGEIERRLRASNICTVENFLIQLLINPQRLKSIVKFKGKKWEAIVNNARACLIGQRVYYYVDPEQKRGIVFNILGRVLRTYSDYSGPSTLSEQQKADLLASACANWEEEVKAFDDQTLLDQHLACLNPYIDTGASEMMPETSSRMSFSGEDGVRDFGYFTTASSGSYDIDNLYNAFTSNFDTYSWSPIILGA